MTDKVNVDSFPTQGEQLGRAVRVCFNYDTEQLVGGVVVRDDTEEPWRTIIRLDDGRHILATECQYSLRPFTRTERRAYGRPQWGSR
jgi:hypothetical protein